jgi:hypothetical protein
VSSWLKHEASSQVIEALLKPPTLFENVHTKDRRQATEYYAQGLTARMHVNGLDARKTRY